MKKTFLLFFCAAMMASAAARTQTDAEVENCKYFNSSVHAICHTGAS